METQKTNLSNFWWHGEIMKCLGNVLGTRICIQKDFSQRELWVKLKIMKQIVKLNLDAKKKISLPGKGSGHIILSSLWGEIRGSGLTSLLSIIILKAAD